jgi:DNA-binding SARP family transcriptional activator
MASSVQFRVLGPLEVVVDGRPVRITAHRQLTTLAALLLRPNRTVPVTRLVAAVWGDNPPATAANQIAICVLALRRALAGAGQDLIVTQPPGYLLRVPAGALDLDRAEELLAQARHEEEGGHLAEAVAHLRDALDLWRGPVLSGIRSGALGPGVTRWEERRLGAAEEYLALQIRLGRHHDAIGELSALVADHPLRERPRALLMLALYRAGRQADALDVYRDARRVLTDELGLQPGAELRAMERSILTHDPRLYLEAPRAPDGAGRIWRPPRQLPADTQDFVGRREQVARLRRDLVGDPADGTRAARVAVVSGAAGTGKTTLAVHIGHLLHRSFADGQLYACLNGTAPRPEDPAEVLTRFLRALGVRAGAVPRDVDERAELYRGLLADRHVLVILDDAADEAQVAPLLPADPSCAVLVTSRVRLTGLAGAYLVELDVLADDEAVELLERIAGPARLAGDRPAAAELVTLCGRLPLAVRIAGARLAAKPHWSVSRLVERLRPPAHRLDELSHGRLAVRPALDRSLAMLDTGTRRAFGRLGRLAAGDFAAQDCAGALGLTPAEAEDVLERLVDARLLDIAGIDTQGRVRYCFGDLVRLYARDLADAPGHADGQEAAYSGIS